VVVVVALAVVEVEERRAVTAADVVCTAEGHRGRGGQKQGGATDGYARESSSRIFATHARY